MATRYVTFEGHTDFVKSLAFIPGTHMLVSGSHDATKRLWDVDEKRPLATLITPFGQRNEWAVVDPTAGSTATRPAGASSNGVCIPAAWTSIRLRIFCRLLFHGLLFELLSAHVDAPRVPPANRSRVVPIVQIRPDSSDTRARRMSVHVSVKQDRDTNAANAAREDVRLFRNGTMVWAASRRYPA